MNPFLLSILTEIKDFSYGFFAYVYYIFFIFLGFDGKAAGSFMSSMNLLKDFILLISSCI